MAVTPRTKYNLRAPDDSELVKDGAKNFRDLCDDIAAALTPVDTAATTASTAVQKGLNGRILRGNSTKITPNTHPAFLNLATVTLPAGVFSGTPILVASVQASATVTCTITAVSATSFSVVVWNMGGGAAPASVNINWLAWGIAP